MGLLSTFFTNAQVAYVEGENIISRLGEFEAGGEIIKHLEGDGRELRDWKHKPISANAYVGARGVQAALEAGADIVISGRCTDASPVIGAAVWWHRWSWDNYNALAGALLAGHCIVSCYRRCYGVKLTGRNVAHTCRAVTRVVSRRTRTHTLTSPWALPRLLAMAPL